MVMMLEWQKADKRCSMMAPLTLFLGRRDDRNYHNVRNNILSYMFCALRIRIHREMLSV